MFRHQKLYEETVQKFKNLGSDKSDTELETTLKKLEKEKEELKKQEKELQLKEKVNFTFLKF